MVPSDSPSLFEPVPALGGASVRWVSLETWMLWSLHHAFRSGLLLLSFWCFLSCVWFCSSLSLVFPSCVRSSPCFLFVGSGLSFFIVFACSVGLVASASVCLPALVAVGSVLCCFLFFLWLPVRCLGSAGPLPDSCFSPPSSMTLKCQFCVKPQCGGLLLVYGRLNWVTTQQYNII